MRVSIGLGIGPKSNKSNRTGNFSEGDPKRIKVLGGDGMCSHQLLSVTKEEFMGQRGIIRIPYFSDQMLLNQSTAY